MLIFTLPCLLVNRVQKRKCYVSEINLTSKSISATYFVICLSLHVFSTVFRHLILKSMNHIYLLSVYTLNTPSTRISLFITTKNVTFFFMLSFGLQNVNCTFVLNSEPVNMLAGTLVVGCFLLNTLFPINFAI